MIEINDACKIYPGSQKDTAALNHVSLEIPDGSLLGIMGVSGAGKTTLLRCLTLLEPLTSGQILMDGVDLCSLPKAKRKEYQRKIGVVFQGYHLFQQRSVYENIAFPLRIRKTPEEVIRNRVMELLALVGLEEKRDAYPVMLSGGQKQRVAIARALAGDPKILLCDEPTSALDAVTTKAILQLLKKINEEKHVTMIIITHELHVVKSICHDVCIINQGEFVEHGKVMDVLAHPQHSFTKFLVGGELDD